MTIFTEMRAKKRRGGHIGPPGLNRVKLILSILSHMKNGYDVLGFIFYAI